MTKVFVRILIYLSINIFYSQKSLSLETEMDKIHAHFVNIFSSLNSLLMISKNENDEIWKRMC